MRIKATFKDLVNSQIRRATKAWSNLPEKAKLRLGTVGVVGVGFLATLALLRGIHMRRYSGMMSERHLQEYFSQAGIVQDMHDNRQKSYLMGNSATQDQMRRLFRS